MAGFSASISHCTHSAWSHPHTIRFLGLGGLAINFSATLKKIVTSQGVKEGEETPAVFSLSEEGSASSPGETPLLLSKICYRELWL